MKKLLNISLAIILVLGLSIVVLPAELATAQTTIYVDDDAPNDPGPGDPTVSDPDENGSAEHPFDRIQEGINAAVSGDTVQVAAGYYPENISLKSGVIVQGAGADVTTIDGSSSGSVVYAYGVGATTKLDGFTITNGSGTKKTSLYTSLYGGAIYLEKSSPTVSNNIIINNTADSGGGIAAYYGSSATISNCTISGNTVTYHGGGILTVKSSLTISNCVISDNSAGNSAGGIGVFYESATISNNIISGNTAPSGGGIYANYWASSTIINNTIIGNSAYVGTGIGATNYCSLSILNNIITGNSAFNLYSQGGGITLNMVTSFTIDYNDLWGNSPQDYYGCSAGPNDISLDPLFVDIGAGDYHLQPGSLCIDVGSNLAPSLPSTDFEGDPRIWPEGGVVDIGADEFMLAQPPVADAGADQTVEQTSYEGAEVILDGSGSNDPDGDPLTYSWTWDGGSDSGVSPTVLLPLGTTTVTLVVNDGELDSDPDTVDITVQDTTPPEVTADLIPTKIKEDKGTCTLVYNVIDICDPNPTVTVVIELPFEEGVDYEYKYKNGVIEVKGPSITLRVTAVDASGNVGTATVTLEFTA